MFDNLDDLIAAYERDMIPLNVYINEYNRLIEEESDKVMSDPTYREREFI